MDARWRIEMLGWLRVTHADCVVSRFRTRKTAALFAYLAFHTHRSHPRDLFVELLWPAYDPDTARTTLRVALSSLRRQLEPPGVPAGSVLLADRATVQLNPVTVVTDVAQFEAALESAARAGSVAERQALLTEAVGLYRGELLPGIYEEWTLPERERLAEAYQQALGRLAADREEAGDLSGAVAVARRAVAADPLREEAHRELIRLLTVAGQGEAAQRQSDEMQRLLERDLGVAPDPQARAAARARARPDDAGVRRAGRPLALPTTPPMEEAAGALRERDRVDAPPLPTGTVTFLFTDIEGSTQLWEQHPQAMPDALARHDALLRRALQAHEGSVFKTMGDQFCAVFASPTDALLAALDAQLALIAQTWEPGGPLRVRIALHTGTAQQRGGDYFGPPVNRVARLLAAAHGGQILLSRATADQVREMLSDGTRLRDLGSYRLRDLQQPEQLFQVLHPALPAEFPPVRSLEAVAHNLPVQLTSFIGREREIVEVKRLLTTTHLLTLTGSGGCGKTRLALVVAADLLEEYANGVWLAELAALSDPALVPQTVAAALGLREEPGRPVTATLTDYLRSRSLLLVLDNCEHLLTACAQLVDSLLRASPQLRVLATSREGLGIAGERTYLVPSLSLPDPRHLPPVERLTEYEAVRLFIERAAFSQPSFAVTEGNAPAVAAVCQRLDGIPLALELAAARVRALPVEKLNERLDDMFRLLTGGSRTALPRQQTLRALMDWSYDLLSEPERAVLRRLSVFAEGWSLEAAEAVCAGDGIEAREVLDLLTSLVDKSLVAYEEQETGARYRLLETVRQYARERLLAASEAEITRGEHLRFFTALAERAEPELRGPDQVTWFERLEREIDNLRAALERSRAHPAELDQGLRLAGALWWFWAIWGYWKEGREWLEALLTLDDPASRTTRRAKALVGASHMVRVGSPRPVEHNQARAYGEEALDLYRELGDKRGMAHALYALGFAAFKRGDRDQAVTLGERSLAQAREVGDKWVMAESLLLLSALSGEAKNDWERATSMWQEGRALYQELGDTRGLLRADREHGWWVAETQGDLERAGWFLNESLIQARILGSKSETAWILGDLADIMRRQGKSEEAAKLTRESLRLYRQLGWDREVVWKVSLLGVLAMASGDPDRAARLLGAEARKRTETGEPPSAFLEEQIAAVRAALDEEAFARAWGEGQAMAWEQAISYALEEPSG